MAFHLETVAMPRLQAYLQALEERPPLEPSTHQLRLGRGQLHRLGGTRVFLCHHHLLALLLRRLGLKAPAGTSLVVAMLSHHRQRGGRLRVVSQRWDRCHPHLPTGWMRSGLLPNLNLNLNPNPSPKSPCGSDLRPLTLVRCGGLMTVQSLSPQAAQMPL